LASAGEVVFERTLAGPPNHPSQIVVRGGSGDITNLSNNSADEHTPDVSPDGSRIAFISNRRGAGYQELWVMSSDGSSAAQLTVASSSNDFSDGFPRWSPDGTKIAYMRSTSSGFNIWVINADGSGATALTSDGLSFHPTWSPDGSKIAYEHMQSSSDQTHIWLMSANGTSQHSVVATPGSYNESYPVWSADGSRIYYNSYTAGYGFWYFNSTDDFATTGSVTRVSVSGANNINGPARFSADGDTLVFNGQGTSGCYQIYTIPTDGGTSTTLTDDDCSAQNFNASYVTATWPNGSTQTLVALGDSIAAGEGINYGWVWDGSSWNQTGSSSPAWLDTTAAIGSDVQACHQSGLGYPAYFFLNGGNYDVYNMACTGASAVSGVLAQQSVGGTMVGAQLGGTCAGCDAVSAIFDGHDPDVVTLTLGADDIHFDGWVIGCYDPLAGSCATTGNTSTLSAELSSQQAKLRLVLSELDRRAGLAGKTLRVLVTNYYDPFPAGTTSCIDTDAGILDSTYPGIGITGTEKAWLVNGLTDLNANIAAEVTYAQTNNSNLDVDLVDISGVMAGHEFCTYDPWVYGPSVNYPPVGGSVGTNSAPFHPTPAGQRAIYQEMMAAV
jgi:Tol biopolymer transport system component